MIAAYGDRTEPVEFLIDKGVEINAQDNSGITAKHIAVADSSSSNPSLGGDHLSIVQLLLSNGADVSINNDLFRSALHEAFLGSDPQPDIAVVSTLLDHGTDPADIYDVPCIALMNGEEYQISEYHNCHAGRAWGGQD